MMRALVLALMTVVATTGTTAGSAALDFRHCDAWKRMSGCDPHGEAIRAARGARRLTDIAALPVTDPGVRLRYEGSIDRGQGNEDWNWGVYRDVRGDWVLMEADGPGCIFNFVQHRFVTDCKAPVFRFYFEGESMPRLEISPAEFGVRSPFFAPLAGAQKWQGK